MDKWNEWKQYYREWEGGISNNVISPHEVE